MLNDTLIRPTAYGVTVPAGMFRAPATGSYGAVHVVI